MVVVFKGNVTALVLEVMGIPINIGSALWEIGQAVDCVQDLSTKQNKRMAGLWYVQKNPRVVHSFTLLSDDIQVNYYDVGPSGTPTVIGPYPLPTLGEDCWLSQEEAQQAAEMRNEEENRGKVTCGTCRWGSIGTVTSYCTCNQTAAMGYDKEVHLQMDAHDCSCWEQKS